MKKLIGVSVLSLVCLSAAAHASGPRARYQCQLSYVVNGVTRAVDSKPAFAGFKAPNLEFTKFERSHGVTGRALISFDENSQKTSAWIDITVGDKKVIARGGSNDLDSWLMTSVGSDPEQFRLDCGQEAMFVKSQRRQTMLPRQ